MNPDQRARAERLAEKRKKAQCSTGNALLDKAVQDFIGIGFEDGYAAGLQDESVLGLVKALKNTRSELMKIFHACAGAGIKLNPAIETINKALAQWECGEQSGNSGKLEEK